MFPPPVSPLPAPLRPRLPHAPYTRLFTWLFRGSYRSRVEIFVPSAGNVTFFESWNRHRGSAPDWNSPNTFAVVVSPRYSFCRHRNCGRRGLGASAPGPGGRTARTPRVQPAVPARPGPPPAAAPGARRTCSRRSSLSMATALKSSPSRAPPLRPRASGAGRYEMPPYPFVTPPSCGVGPPVAIAASSSPRAVQVLLSCRAQLRLEMEMGVVLILRRPHPCANLSRVRGASGVVRARRILPLRPLLPTHSWPLGSDRVPKKCPTL